MTEGIKKTRTSWDKLSFIHILQRIWQFFGGRLIFGLIAAIGALLFFLWFAYEVFENETKIFDENIRSAIHQTAAPWLTQVMIFLSFVGSAGFLTGLAVIVLIIFWRLKWKRAIVLFLITMAGELVLTSTLKLFFHRLRPEPFFNYPLPNSYSFPSGHALGSFCFFGSLAWLITARLENRPLKIAVWTLAGLLVFFIGFSRIYLGVHFPSDVIAGFTAAFVWVLTVSFTDFWLKRRTAENKSDVLKD